MNQLLAPVFGISRLRIPVDGEGVTTLVAFSHCPLCCAYCLNPQCEDEAYGQNLSPAALLDKVRVDNLYFLASGGGICFGGGEPCLRSLFIEEFSHLADSNWKLTIETSLAVPEEHILRLIPLVDQWIIDVKDMHPEIYLNYTKRSIETLLHNLHLLADRGLQERCILRIPLIPEYNTPALQTESRQLLEEMGFSRFDVFKYLKPNQGKSPDY